MMRMAVLVLGYAFMVAGVFFSFASAVGLLRFPDVYTRLHAGTKALTGGAFFVLAGVALHSASWQATAKILLIAGFFLATNPIATHAIARACYRHGIMPEKIFVDDYGKAMKRGMHR